MCCETWPRTTLPGPQLKAHYGTGPWVLVRYSQSVAELLLPPGMASGLSLWGRVCQRGTTGTKFSWLSVSIGLCLVSLEDRDVKGKGGGGEITRT